ncbi:DNA mismatch repair protein MutL [Candidatus Similichlamydia laticola]|uniref:DNA mismatch repair protein MutL n=2 Tax=Candidatus Similichlamydia laticola TaxID=2170265 RepID=A0A369KCC8_9BACT|nr:DNA mismatch repair protein MutL [Candidatus Similichlamydia laticola]
MILRVFSELALAHPEVHFLLEKDGELLFDLPPSSFQEMTYYLDRVSMLLGYDFSKALVPLEAHHSVGKLFGIVTRPEHSFPYRTSQYFFLNKRSIVSSLLSRALADAYEHLLPKGRVPGCLLFLEMAGHLVDVNVHPRKREVRFQDEQAIRLFVRDSVVHKFSIGESNIGKAEDRVWIEPSRPLQETLPVWSFPEIEKSLPPCQGDMPLQKEEYHPILDWSRAFVAPLRTYVLLDAAVCREAYPAFASGEEWALIDCLHALFLLSQKGRGIKERLSQFLTIPIEQSVSPCSIELMEGILHSLAPLGFSFMRSGPVQFSIHEIPASWSREESKCFIEDLAKNPSSDHLSHQFLLLQLRLSKGIRLTTYVMQCIVEKVLLCMKEGEEMSTCCVGWSPHRFFRC